MRIAFIAFLLSAVSTFGQCVSNYFITFAAGTNGSNVSVSDLSASTYAPGAFYWTVSAPSTMRYTNDAQQQLLSAKDLCVGGSQIGGDSLGFVTRMTTGGGYCFFYPTNPGPKLSLGVWVKSLIPDDQYTPDFLAITSANGTEFNNAKLLYFGAMHIIEMESPDVGSSYANPNIYVASNSWYWFTMLYNASATTNHEIRVYDASTNLLGWIHPTVPCSSTQNVARVAIGISNPQANSGNMIYLDSLVIDASANPVFPLMPYGGPPAGPVATMNASRINVGTIRAP